MSLTDVRILWCSICIRTPVPALPICATVCRTAHPHRHDSRNPPIGSSLPVAMPTRSVCSYRRTAQVGRDAVERMHYTYFFGRHAQLGALRLTHSFDHTLWAMGLVRSRTFGLTISAEPVSVMAPYLDLANHSDRFTCSFRASDDECASDPYPRVSRTPVCCT